MLFTSNLLLSTADIAGISRLDASTLPAQTRMELLVAAIPQHALFDDEYESMEVCKWRGILCDADDNVKQVRFALMFSSFFPKGGTVALQWLPETVTTCTMLNNNLEGECDTALLPRGMMSLNLAINQMSGEFAIGGIPETMESVLISQNHFSGSLRLEDLPERMQRFDAHKNDFCGSLNVANLPESLMRLTLDRDKFAADFSVVRDGIEGLWDNHHSLFDTLRPQPRRPEW